MASKPLDSGGDTQLQEMGRVLRLAAIIEGKIVGKESIMLFKMTNSYP